MKKNYNIFSIINIDLFALTRYNICKMFHVE